LVYYFVESNSFRVDKFPKYNIEVLAKLQKQQLKIDACLASEQKLTSEQNPLLFVFVVNVYA